MFGQQLDRHSLLRMNRRIARQCAPHQPGKFITPQWDKPDDNSYKYLNNNALHSILEKLEWQTRLPSSKDTEKDNIQNSGTKSGQLP